MKGILELITEAIKLNDRVEQLASKVSDMAKIAREENTALRDCFNALDKRVVRIETFIEISEKRAFLKNE